MDDDSLLVEEHIVYLWGKKRFFSLGFFWNFPQCFLFSIFYFPFSIFLFSRFILAV